MINVMKNNISISIEQKILQELKEVFPGEKRSQVIEKALEFWTMRKKQSQLRSDALKIMSVAGTGSCEVHDLENSLISDGLDDL